MILDFWKSPSEAGKEVHVMISDEKTPKFLQELDDHSIAHSVMIDDVQKVIVEQKEKRDKLRKQVRLHDWREQKVQFNLAQYHSFADVINYLNSLAITYPELVSVQPIGTTHEGRQIPLIKITNKRNGGTKRGIWVDGGIHAREWVSPSTVLYFIHQLVTQYDKDAQIRQFVDQLEWYIVPLLNPDGYEYSRSSNDPEIRLWRKNRSPPKCIQQATGLFQPPTTTCCQGVDLNRNFDWFFGQVGSSTDPCSEIYQGAYAFSEPETAAVRDFVQRHRISTFLTFHSYSQILMYPFGHQVRTYSNDLNDLSQKKKELEKKKKSKSNSKSSKKLKPTVTRKPLAPPLPPPQPKIVPQVPIQSKSTTDETMTPPIQQIPTSHETGSVVTSPAPSEEVIRVEEAPREEVPREEVTVLCTYGNGWTKKSKPPRDFTFSIESE
uniref:Peptidase_M14 domain-containing protein n=1 Tax=Caenorhabditis tropicalis TaxID=1561998 RepID=A0A1I7URE7_9PELO